MNLSYTSMTIEGIDLEVAFYYHKGYPQTRYEPEEYPEVEINSVICGEVDIGCLLSDDTFNKIETYILENANKERD
jgi:hypothetical protein